MKIYEYEIVVDEQVIDINGHVNNVTYLSWYIDAAVNHLGSLGLDFEYLKTLGVTWVAKEHHIEYKRPAFKDEVLTMTTWIEEVASSSAKRMYLLKNSEDKVVGEAYTTWVMVDNVKGRPCRIPSDVIARYT